MSIVGSLVGLNIAETNGKKLLEDTDVNKDKNQKTNRSDDIKTCQIVANNDCDEVDDSVFYIEELN